MSKLEILAVNVLAGVIAGAMLGVIEVIHDQHKIRKAAARMVTDAETAANEG